MYGHDDLYRAQSLPRLSILHWKTDGYSLRKLADGLVGDDEADVIEVTDFTGRQKLRYFFSKTSGLMLKKEWFDSAGRERGGRRTTSWGTIRD